MVLEAKRIPISSIGYKMTPIKKETIDIFDKGMSYPNQENTPLTHYYLYVYNPHIDIFVHFSYL